MWLVYLKVMYDSFGWAKVVIWLCIIYLVGRVLYEMFGWLGIAIPIFIIIGLIVYFLIIEPRLERRRYEEMSKTNPAVVKKHKKVLKQYLPKKEHKENPVPKFKKRLSNEEAELAYQKAIIKNPDAVSDITMQGDDKIYRLYWLSKEEPDNDLFDVNFTIRKDCQSMDVTITNTSDKSIDVDWKQFKIDRRSALLNGLSWIDFKGNGKIEPGQSSTVSVQPSIYNEGSPMPMFDLDKIKEEEIVYKVSFHVKSPITSNSRYSYAVHTKLRVIF
jgi:hypothetical protein